MRIKRVEAATVAEALRLLRAELGDHALILHTKTLAAPGPLRAGRVEVMGAVDEPRGTVPPPAPAPISLPKTVREAVAMQRSTEHGPLYRSASSDQGVGGPSQSRVAALSPVNPSSGISPSSAVNASSMVTASSAVDAAGAPLELEVLMVESPDARMRPDGNNVDIDRQMARVAQNTLYHNVVVQLLMSRFNGLKSAINGRA